MVIKLETELITIAEAARLLKVSAITIRRWLKQGRLQAYRLGPRHIRIYRADLNGVLTPVADEDGSIVKEILTGQGRLEVQPPSEEQVKQRLEAIADSEELIEQMLARRKGKPLPPSWPLIRQAREERSRRL